MFTSTAFVALAAFGNLVAAQAYTAADITLDPNTVPIALRQSWCNTQTENCPLVCGGQAFPNDCFPDTLQYNCTCTTGATPNISDYANMIPAYRCQTWQKNCVAASDNATEQRRCNSIACGSKAADLADVSTSAPASATTGTTTNSTRGSTTSSGSVSRTSGATTSPTTGAAMTVAVPVQQYGGVFLITGLLALFGFAL